MSRRQEPREARHSIPLTRKRVRTLVLKRRDDTCPARSLFPNSSRFAKYRARGPVAPKLPKDRIHLAPPLGAERLSCPGALGTTLRAIREVLSPERGDLRTGCKGRRFLNRPDLGREPLREHGQSSPNLCRLG